MFLQLLIIDLRNKQYIPTPKRLSTFSDGLLLLGFFPD